MSWKRFWIAAISLLGNKGSNSFGKTNSPEHNNDAQVRDVRPAIQPAMPATAQARILCGIALAMVVVIAFSGRKGVHETKAPISATPPPIVEPSQERIQEYRTTIDDAAHKLAAEEKELARTKVELNNRLPGYPPSSTEGTSTLTRTETSLTGSGDHYDRQADPIVIERDKRDHQSLFSSNIALSYRSPAPSAPAANSSSSLREAILATLNPPPQVAPLSIPTTSVGFPSKEEPSTDRYPLLEGTIIETVLTNRLDSSFSGPVNCMVTTNVYSRDHAILLIPQGSRVLGEAKRVDGVGDQRLAVFFHRLIRPDDYAISFDRFQGLDQIGETGLKDQVNHHYLQIFGASVAIGTIAGLAQSNTRYGTTESPADVYEQGVASSLSQSAMHVLDRFLNVLPTFTVREGQRIKVYVSQDLKVPAYEPKPEKGALP